MNILTQFIPWAARNLPAAEAKAKPTKLPKAPKVYTSITPIEARAIEALSPSRVTYCVGGYDKRFASNMQGETKITESQRTLIWKMVNRYRRQIADKGLVKLAEGMVDAK